MLISGVSNLSHSASATAQIPPQPLPQLFQQLEQAALQSGAAAPTTPQSTFLTPPSSSPIAQALAQFSQSGTAGNAPLPQQDYSAPQTAPSQTTTQTHAHLHHHHGEGGGSNALSQLFEQLGQDLQSGNLAEAQQAYGALISDLPQTAQTSVASATQPTTSGVSVTT